MKRPPHLKANNLVIIMNKIIFISVVCILGSVSCKSQTTIAKNGEVKPITIKNHPKFIAIGRAFIIPLDTVKKEIDFLIDNYFQLNPENRIKDLRSKQLSFGIFPDSCGNIKDVTLDVAPFGRAYNPLEIIIMDYLYSLKKLNIYYRDFHKQLQYLEAVSLYIEFDENGKIIKFY
jgi:hypothetical protein